MAADTNASKRSMPAREQSDVLFEDGSLEEFGMYVTSRAVDFVMAEQMVSGDGVFTDWGTSNIDSLEAMRQLFDFLCLSNRQKQPI